MATIGPYKISSCNARGPYPAKVRVLRGKVLLADVVVQHARPLYWIRTRPRDAARSEFVKQLLEMQVSMADIEMLLKLPEEDQA